MARKILAWSVRVSASGYRFTNSPSLNMAFSQHHSFLQGQPGDLSTVISKFSEDLNWFFDSFAIHTDVMRGQEEVNQNFIEQVYDAGYNGLGWSAIKNMPVRNLDPIANVDYLTPAGVAEATVPLEALIAMFSTDDSAAITTAARWRSAADQLELAVGQLHSAAGVLAANTMGVSFDRAREAIEDISRVGTVVATNARVMEQSMLQFPVVRAQNLASLQAIEASTMGITEPAARVAAQQAAVVSFVTGTLQPSLELVRPPVVNLGVPVDGHTGGGVLTVGGDTVATPRVRIDGVAGGVPSSGVEVAGVAEQASPVTRQGASPVGESVAQPAAERVTAERVGVDPAAARPVVGEQPPVNSAGVNAAGLNSAGARSVVQPAGLGSPAAPMPYNTMQYNTPTTQTRGRATTPLSIVNPGSPSSSNIQRGHARNLNASFPSPRDGARSPGTQRLPQLPFSAQEAQRQAEAAKNNLQSGSTPGSKNGASAQPAPGATGAARSSAMGTAHGSGMLGAGGRGSHQPKSATSSRVKATPAVRDYFLREFFGKGSRKRTVRKVIDRG